LGRWDRHKHVQFDVVSSSKVMEVAVEKKGKSNRTQETSWEAAGEGTTTEGAGGAVVDQGGKESGRND